MGPIFLDVKTIIIKEQPFLKIYFFVFWYLLALKNLYLRLEIIIYYAAHISCGCQSLLIIYIHVKCVLINYNYFKMRMENYVFFHYLSGIEGQYNEIWSSPPTLNTNKF